MSHLRFEKYETGNVNVIEIHGQMLLNNLSKIRKRLMGEMKESNIKNFILDLSNVVSIDSNGIGFIIMTLKVSVRSRKGNMVLVIPKGSVMEVSKVIVLEKVLKVHETIEDARRYLLTVEVSG